MSDFWLLVPGITFALDVPAMKTLKTLVRSRGYARLRTGRLPSRSDRGGAIIELVVLSPLLLVLVFGAGDFGRIMYYAITLTNSARAGAAYGSHMVGQAIDETGIQVASEEEAQEPATDYRDLATSVRV